MNMTPNSPGYARRVNPYAGNQAPAMSPAFGDAGYAEMARGGQGFNVGYILNVLRTWWWLILGLMTVVTIVTALYVNSLTPVYRGAALIEVKSPNAGVNVAADKEFFTTQIQLLGSEKLIESVDKTLDLSSDAYFLRPDTGAQTPTQQARDRIETFKRNLTVTPVGSSRLVQVAFHHSNPDKAALIANTLTRSFINSSLMRQSDANTGARMTLQTQLANVKASLESAERDLVNYAQDNNLIGTSGDNGQAPSGALDMASLITLDSDLTAARSERVEAEQKYQQSLSSNFASDVMNSLAIKELNTQRIKLQTEYQDKQTTFKPKHPDMLELQSRIGIIDSEIAQETAAIIGSLRAEIKDNYDLAVRREQDLQSRVASLKGSVNNVRTKSVDYNILLRQVETERAQYDALLEKLKAVSLSADIDDGPVQIIDTAIASRSPFSPNKKRLISTALLMSLLLGVILAFLLDKMDDRVKTPEDVKFGLNQIIMGVIPKVEKGADITENLKNAQTAISESYASLRTNVQYAGPDGGPRVVQITSTRPGEGKSVSSLGLALRFVGVDDRVLLIDADLRRPTFAPDESGAMGLSGVLTQDASFEDHILQTRFNNLHLMTSGNSVPNPAELLSSRRFDELIEFARENYEYVVIDSPPALGLADAPILGAKVDATLLVVEAAQLSVPAVNLTVERLERSGTNILGVVLTKYRPPKSGYGDHYAYGYGKNSYDYGAPKGGKLARKKENNRKLDITS